MPDGAQPAIGRHGATVPRGLDAPPPPGARGGRFGRMFGFLPRRDAGDAIGDLLALIRRESEAGDVDNPAGTPAGYTYLGQFIDHDITFDPTSKLDRDNDPAALENFRTPRLDLDSLYGSGPDDQPYLYESERAGDRGLKLLVGGTTHPDLPRNAQGRALIGDARNDENLIVAQLHLLLLRFHNAVVDHLRAGHEGLAREELFARAQRLVRWHYQWIVVHDFLERIVGADLARDVLQPARDGAPPRVVRRHFDCGDAPSIPVEFSGAAYRFGHSMVRPNYAIRRGLAAVPILGSSDPHLGGLRALPADLVIDWRRFFFERDDLPLLIDGRPATVNIAQRMNHKVAPPLLALPPDGTRALPDLNIRRGRALGLPAGADVAHAMGERELSDAELLLERIPSEPARALLRDAMPLWYYVLREADSRAGGSHLGPVGGRIVAEVLVGLLAADPQSYLRQWPTWRPELGPSAPDDFRMSDLVAFVRDAPPSA